MNHGKLLLLALCTAALFLLSGCQSKAPSILPVTGVQGAVPAQITRVRDNALKYVLSSPRLPELPKDADWQLETGEGSEKEYCFRSGNWRMMIRLADEDDNNQFVIIVNKVSHASWTGYITPKGHVVDTAYGR